MTKNSSPNFQQLVLLHKKDDSYEAISKRAGGVPKARALQSIVKDGFTRMPSPETFAGLAKALNVSPRELVLAAARTLGIDVGDDNESDMVLWGAGRLPEESKTVLRNTATELMNWMDGSRQKPEDDTEGTVLQFPKPKSAPDFDRMAGMTEPESEGKAEAARSAKSGEESQDRE